jgi:hypothetical protein
MMGINGKQMIFIMLAVCLFLCFIMSYIFLLNPCHFKNKFWGYRKKLVNWYMKCAIRKVIRNKLKSHLYTARLSKGKEPCSYTDAIQSLLSSAVGIISFKHQTFSFSVLTVQILDPIM